MFHKHQVVSMDNDVLALRCMFLRMLNSNAAVRDMEVTSVVWLGIIRVMLFSIFLFQ